MHRCERLKRDKKLSLKVALAMMIGGLVGARFLFIIYHFHDYLSSPLWETLAIWKGGFVFYGGFLGGGLASYCVLTRRGQPVGIWADFLTPLVSLGYALGRLACFLNGCCYGKLCSLPWAFQGRHPTQLYASLWELSLFILLLIQEKKAQESSSSSPGDLFFLWLGGHALGRLVMEIFRDDFRGPVYFFSLPVWMSFIFILLSVFYFFQRNIGFFKRF